MHHVWSQQMHCTPTLSMADVHRSMADVHRSMADVN